MVGLQLRAKAGCRNACLNKKVNLVIQKQNKGKLKKDC